MERLVALLHVEDDGQRVDEPLAVDAAGEAPQVSGPHALDVKALGESSEHGVDQLAQVAVDPLLAKIRIVFGVASGERRA